MSNPFGDLISRGEGSYDSFNRGNAGDSHGQAIDFSQMTLGEVQAAQHLGRHDPHRLFAVGKYQIIPDTMDDAVRRLKLDPNQKFTPELQERIFADYLIAGKRPQIAAYIQGEPGATLHASQKAASQEWASVEDPDTPGKPYAPYLKNGNNHSSITSGQIASVLDTMRTEYQADLAKGMKPDEAWRSITHSTIAHVQTTHSPTVRDRAILNEGTRGPAIATLQADLATLGYSDGRGHLLKADGEFGILTRHAVERFQHDHHLTVDGKVGPLTQQALHAALREHATTHDLTNPHNPDHTLFEQALAGVRTLDAQHGRASNQHSLNLAAALTAEAKREGLTRIDQVALSEDASRTIAVQQPTLPTEIMPRYAGIVTMAGLQTPMAESTARTAAVPPPAESVVRVHQPPTQAHALSM